MKVKKFRYFACDFETTVYDGQEHTEVWASAISELFTDETVIIHHSIGETLDYFIGLDCNVCCYYHNLKFDGSFCLSYLLLERQYRQAYIQKGQENLVEWLHDNEMPDRSFKYSISDKGQWYSIIIHINKHYIEIRDSLKLLPFSIKKIGKSFGTKHKKLEMEYKGFRYAGCDITDEEQKYIANDVLVLKEALEIMFTEGHKQLTIGSCCLHEYKSIMTKKVYESIFPDVSNEFIPSTFGSTTVDEYVRKSYKGGWCYVVRGKENIVYHNGITADVNSLYPSMMSSESGNRYPVGMPTFWQGNYIPEEATQSNRYYFVRIKTRFYLKENMLPFIQIKSSFLYMGNEMLETSDVYDRETDTYCTYTINDDGTINDTRVTLTLTMTDYQLLLDHYDLVDFEILDGCYFESRIGLFDEYIEKYKKIKLTSKGAKRELAKLFLNNLYGKLASSTNSSFKVAYIKDDKSIGFFSVYEQDKDAGYIPTGSAITSYARNFTIRTAQKNYYGRDKRGFIYADTDSIHCDLTADEITGLKIHDRDFCCWKLESYWDEAIFVRQKTYMEHVTHEDGEPIDEPYYNLKCAGMPERCKGNFLENMKDIREFKVGIKVDGKLMPKRIHGGIVLVDTTYEMR